MSGKKKIVRPRYQQIAVDLAERIVENRYKVGERSMPAQHLPVRTMLLLRLPARLSMCW